jgi:2-polyprenyl-3-methyl-5-hydroxy-6-metoxy-1,4-benzoquinol methylase
MPCPDAAQGPPFRPEFDTKGRFADDSGKGQVEIGNPNQDEAVAMDVKTHWEKIYTTKASDQVSWYRQHLETSLALIERAASNLSASIIDVGGGESTLVDDLIARGFQDVTVLDVSQVAIEACRKRLGESAERVHWLVADITQVELGPGAYDVWHDRAVFHFLTDPQQRVAYVRQVARSVRPGGHVIVSTFGPEGPTKCSGLDVVRYDSDSLHREFGARFRLVDSSKELHETPFGTTQQFLYCYCRVE